MSELSDIGVAGLAVMGENLALNMEGRGFTVACCNRTAERVDEFLAGRGSGRQHLGCDRHLFRHAANLCGHGRALDPG